VATRLETSSLLGSSGGYYCGCDVLGEGDEGMKLLINDEVFNKEPQVIIRLVYRGSLVSLMIQKQGEAEQAVLEFLPNGTVRRLTTYTDIGFKTGGDGRIVISG